MSAPATATSPAGAQRGNAGAHRATVRLTPRAAVLFVAFLLMGVFAVAPIRAYLDHRVRLMEMQRQADVLERQNDALHAKILDLEDPRTLERLARECLGMVRPGEVGFVVIPKGEAPTPPDCR